ncbi:Leu/Phe/Val dehydrogenase [Flavobacteriaceae bacterium LMO-SS05]
MTLDVIHTHDLLKVDPVFGQLSFDNHEQVVFCSDKDTGLKAIIGIHNSVLGPALGGARMRVYNSEWEALNDVLRLSRCMTLKAAISGLNLGGGKAVILGDPNTQKTPELIHKFGEFVHALGGKYITAEDVGTNSSDMDSIREVTPYVTGISKSKGGTGNPSPISAFGVFMGMKAAAKFKFGSDVLEGKNIFVEGVGSVGEALIENLLNEGADVTITDIDEERLEAVRSKFQVAIYRGPDFYNESMDIYAPCALGATINDSTIYKLKAKVIAGSANIQLEDEVKHGRILKERGIIYAPDFLINAGGLINVNAELESYDNQEAIRKTENIYNTTLEILKRAKDNNMATNTAAVMIANERIEARAKENLEKKRP